MSEGFKTPRKKIEILGDVISIEKLSPQMVMDATNDCHGWYAINIIFSSLPIFPNALLLCYSWIIVSKRCAFSFVRVSSFDTYVIIISIDTLKLYYDYVKNNVNDFLRVSGPPNNLKMYRFYY